MSLWSPHADTFVLYSPVLAPGLPCAPATSELGLASPDALCDFDLSLYDTQPATLGGLYREFVYAARIDNLMMT